MKSKYFGYMLRGAGTPYQQWVLSDLPISVVGAYTTSSTSEIAAASNIPLQSISFNQIGARLNSDGTLYLPQGIYKVEFSGILSTTAAGPVKIDLTSNSTVIAEVQGYTATSASSTFTDTISGSGIVKVCGSAVLSLINNSATSITPVLAGSDSFRVIITRIS